MSTGRFLGSDVINVSTRDAETAFFFRPAARALTARFYGGEVVGKGCVAEIQGAGGDDGVAEALVESSARDRGPWACRKRTYGGSCGPDTVEHVRAEGDGDEEILGVADAHYVAGFVLREPVCAGIYAEFPPSARF